jgi:hypothetical protein
VCFGSSDESVYALDADSGDELDGPDGSRRALFAAMQNGFARHDASSIFLVTGCDIEDNSDDGRCAHKMPLDCGWNLHSGCES